MAMNEVLAHIDAEIARLTQARALLADIQDAPRKAGRGRPKGSKNASTVAADSGETGTAAKKSKRKLSPEGRKAIADAMKRRWAERRKVVAK